MTSFARELCVRSYSCETSLNSVEAFRICVVVKKTPFFCVANSWNWLLLRMHEES